MVVLAITFLFTQPAQAGTAKEMLSKYDTATKVNIALGFLRGTYPDWSDNYQPGEFDCSEMSAYVKYCFRQWGIRSTYCQSDALWHCWVEVPCPDGKILIEATTLKIVPGSRWDHYYQYGDVRCDRKMLLNEINWWHSNYINGRQLPPGIIGK